MTMCPEIPSLYSRLSRYASSAEHSPLENFLTESLCDLFQRMSSIDRHALLDIVNSLFFGADTELGKRTRDAIELTWTTQEGFSLENQEGRPDLWLYADGELVLLAENKIDASLTGHQLGDAEVNQLRFYDEWLARTSSRAALVLLTHLTPEPPGFIEDTNASDIGTVYRSSARRKCPWTSVYRELKQWRDHCGSGSTHEAAALQQLVLEFLRFLEEKGMATPVLDSRDVETLTAFLRGTGKKIWALSDAARQRASNILPQPSGYPLTPPRLELPDRETLWDWAYCYERERTWYVGWGFAGKNALGDLAVPFADDCQAFVVVTSESSKEEIPVRQSQEEECRKQGWTIVPRGGRYRVRRFLKVHRTEALLSSSEGFGESYLLWMEQALREAAAILSDAHQTVTARAAHG